MFTPLPGRTTLELGPDRIVAIIESLNAPNIAIPELGTEPTKAWLVGCLTPAGGACVFCCLLPNGSRRPMLYVSNPPEVPLASYSLLENESIQYVESMGFLLDNLNFRARPPHEQVALLASLPPFRGPQEPAAPSPTTPAPDPTDDDAALSSPATQAALVRLLASF